jgi:hypothetical protein
MNFSRAATPLLVRSFMVQPQHDCGVETLMFIYEKNMFGSQALEARKIGEILNFEK